MNKVYEKYKKNILGTIIILLIISLLGVFFKDYIYNIDLKILDLIREFVSEGITTIMKAITNMSSVSILCGISILILLFVRNKEIGLLIAVNLGIATTFNYILKLMFNRQRPFGYMLLDQSGYSFPSGHSMISMAFYGFLIYLLQKYFRDNNIKKSLILLLTLLISLIGFSRLYLGVHYPSDVIIGLYLGYIYLRCFITFITKQKYI